MFAKIWFQANKEEPLRKEKITMKSIYMHSYGIESDKQKNLSPPSLERFRFRSRLANNM
jgi:hypothetical protein